MTSFALPRRRLWAALTAFVCVAAVAVPIAARGDADVTREHAAPPLTMADSLGLGGFANITVDAGEQPLPRSLLEDSQIVAYYGSPRQPAMGILGEHGPEQAAWLLAERAARFDALNGDAGVTPALHLVYGVAQPEAGTDGLHLLYVDDRTVRSYLALARRYGFVLVIDLQIGHSSALDEVRKVVPYLAEPDVHLALDPEFALAGGAQPGDAIGSLDASDINAVQALVGEFTRDHQLPRKVLIVHQFEASMITSAATLEQRDDVDLIIDMDGYGPADIKTVKYATYGAASYAPHGGIKIFLRHDPDPMSEQQLLDLEPRPSYFVYQ